MKQLSAGDRSTPKTKDRALDEIVMELRWLKGGMEG
jgi:hypothetical protein